MNEAHREAKRVAKLRRTERQRIETPARITQLEVALTQAEDGLTAVRLNKELESLKLRQSKLAIC